MMLIIDYKIYNKKSLTSLNNNKFWFTYSNNMKFDIQCIYKV